ncbi:MAG: sulfite exporter TauE/SafE family protein [Thermodesulfovibrionales bacterium]|nr:sulfite exporter TauE/SafE family protein [Thermodesulfovibrionales bacterium]
MLGDSSVFLLMFGTGFFGGFGHCTGMCGPLIATYCLTIPQSPFEKSLTHLIYHSGRLMSYSLIGGFMGLSGSFISMAGSITIIQSIAMALAGIFMIMTGFSILYSGISSPKRFVLLKLIPDVIKKISETVGTGKFFPLGLINGIIPCGLSYTAYIAAAGTGASEVNPAQGFLKGMFLLLLFGSGTLPSLLLLTYLISKGKSIIRKRLYGLAGVFIILSGSVFLYRSILFVANE